MTECTPSRTIRLKLKLRAPGISLPCRRQLQGITRDDRETVAFRVIKALQQVDRAWSLSESFPSLGHP